MAYTIRNTDGTILVLLGDGKVDTNSTSIALIGKNYGNYGEFWNNNLIKLMGHFANSSSPTNPLKGQIYYNTITRKLNVFDEEWEPINGARVSNTLPTTLSEGDLWFDESNNQLYIDTESGIKLIGPKFSSQIGDNGWVLPTLLIQDNTNGTSGNVKQVTLLRNYGTTLGYVANEKFTIATTSTNAYITTATTSTVKGLTILGDIRASETVYANTLTVTSSIVFPTNERVSKIVDVDFEVQIGNFIFRMYAPPGPSLYPQMKTASGTVSVLAVGFYIKMNEPLAEFSRTISLTTTDTNIIDPDPSIDFDEVGDMLQMIMTDNINFNTYRVTMQLVGTGNKASIVLEKLV